MKVRSGELYSYALFHPLFSFSHTLHQTQLSVPGILFFNCYKIDIKFTIFPIFSVQLRSIPYIHVLCNRLSMDPRTCSIFPNCLPLNPLPIPPSPTPEPTTRISCFYDCNCFRSSCKWVCVVFVPLQLVCFAWHRILGFTRLSICQNLPPF